MRGKELWRNIIISIENQLIFDKEIKIGNKIRMRIYLRNDF
jgi:hypothetical protein